MPNELVAILLSKFIKQTVIRINYCERRIAHALQRKVINTRYIMKGSSGTKKHPKRLNAGAIVFDCISGSRLRTIK